MVVRNQKLRGRTGDVRENGTFRKGKGAHFGYGNILYLVLDSVFMDI